MTTYRIVRFYQEADRQREVIEEGVTLQEAREHCRQPDTSGDGWFDGYERQEEADDE